MTAPLLRTEHLSKEFGGVHAVEDLGFALTEGTIHSIIGPNGAGKTTVFNLITGLYIPSAGRIFFQEEDVTALEPHELAALGMSRTFQNLQIFFNMSAMENVMVGMHLRLDRRFLPTLFRLGGVGRKEDAARDRAAELMRFVGLEAYLDADSASMPFGALKRLEIARALAAEPRLLLLDEPAAGLNTAETEAIDDLIRKTAETGVTVVLVEHDMRLVMGVSDHILVLDNGRRLGEGTVAEIQSNPDVITAYLGPRPWGRTRMPEVLLEVRDVSTHYGRIQALRGVSLEIREGELVALVGNNGAGKSTLLHTVCGIQPPSSGDVLYRGQSIRRERADKRVRMGIAQVPEARQVFGAMSVEDNLLMGAFTRPTREAVGDLDAMWAKFPMLADKRKQSAGTLSGGQQQMLAIARALMARPKLLLMDEPSMGLAPKATDETFATILALKKAGTTILLVEQNASSALAVADRGYVLETGHIVLEGTGEALLNDERIKSAYLGMGMSSHRVIAVEEGE